MLNEKLKTFSPFTEVESKHEQVAKVMELESAKYTPVMRHIIDLGLKAYFESDKKKTKAVEVKKTSTKFTPPGKNEVLEYFLEKGSDKEEAKSFWYFYDSKNWMVGKTKMSKWRSSASNWINKNKKHSNKTNSKPSLTDLMNDERITI